MSQIPTIPIAIYDGEARTGGLRFNGTTVRADIDTDLSEKVREIVERFGIDSNVVMVDTGGLENRAMEVQTVRKVKFRKVNVWLLTFIGDVGDVFDAFNMDIETLLVPYHTIRSPSELSDIFQISDNCIPALFIEKGYVVTKKGHEDIHSVLRSLKKITSGKIAIFDINGNYDLHMWENIASEYDGIIPFVPKASEEFIHSMEELGFFGVMVLF